MNTLRMALLGTALLAAAPALAQPASPPAGAPAPGGPAAGPRGDRGPGAMFNQIDANKDGKLSKQEFTEACRKGLVTSKK